MKSKTVKILKKETKKSKVPPSTELGSPIELVDSNRGKEGILELSFKKKEEIVKTGKRMSKRKKVILGVLVFFLILLGIGVYLFVQYIYNPAQRVIGYATEIQNNALSIVADIKEKDISNIDQYFSGIEGNIEKIEAELENYEFLKEWDQTRGYYQNFEQSQVVLGKVDLLLEKTLPKLKNILKATGFKVDASDNIAIEDTEVEEEELDSLSLILRELPQYLALYEEIEPDILDIFAEVRKLDPEYIPNLGDYDLKERFYSFVDFTEEYPVLADKTINFVRHIPNLIGSNEETTYLLVLQNESEMRSSGGLITSFGTVSVTNGEFDEGIDLRNTWSLQNDLWGFGLVMPHNNIYGQAYLMNNGCGATEARAQDVGLYPDLFESMMMFKDYYNLANRYNRVNYPDYDHVMILNFKFAEDLLGLVQPLVVEGFGEVNAENLFDFIKAETDDPKYSAFSDERKEIIGKIGEQAKKKLFELPVTEFPNVIKTIVKSIQAKDIGFATEDATIQAFFDEYGMSARTVTDFDTDYFQLSEAQNCALKVNKWMRNRVINEAHIGENGDINKVVWVNWWQPQIYNDSLIGQYSASISHSYRAWVRAILPPEVDRKIIKSDGYSRSGYLYYYPQAYYDAVMDKTVSDNIIQFDYRRFKEEDPIKTQDLNIQYSLPESLNYSTTGKYSLILQKHPGKSWGEEQHIRIFHNGSTYEVSFILDRDKIVSYREGILSVDNYDKKLDWINNLVDKIPWEKIKEESEE